MAKKKAKNVVTITVKGERRDVLELLFRNPSDSTISLPLDGQKDLILLVKNVDNKSCKFSLSAEGDVLSASNLLKVELLKDTDEIAGGAELEVIVSITNLGVAPDEEVSFNVITNAR